MTEIQAQKEFCRLANRQGAHAIRLNDRYNIGIPDINMGWAGTDWWLEMKLERGEVTAQQRDFLVLRRPRGLVLRVYDKGMELCDPALSGTGQWVSGLFPEATHKILQLLAHRAVR